MKISNQHFEKLKSIVITEIEEQNTAVVLYGNHNNLAEKYRQRDIFRGSSVKNINVRLRWDMFNLAIKRPENKYLLDELYEYLNDDHIDTALKNIVKDIE